MSETPEQPLEPEPIVFCTVKLYVQNSDAISEKVEKGTSIRDFVTNLEDHQPLKTLMAKNEVIFYKNGTQANQNDTIEEDNTTIATGTSKSTAGL